MPSCGGPRTATGRRNATTWRRPGTTRTGDPRKPGRRACRTVMLCVSREGPDGQSHLLADLTAVLFVFEHPLSRHACDLLAEARHTLGGRLFGWDADGEPLLTPLFGEVGLLVH